jgi:hypothetical protein
MSLSPSVHYIFKIPDKSSRPIAPFVESLLTWVYFLRVSLVSWSLGLGPVGHSVGSCSLWYGCGIRSLLRLWLVLSQTFGGATLISFQPPGPFTVAGIDRVFGVDISVLRGGLNCSPHQIMATTPGHQQPKLDRYVVIHVATTCDEHGVYVTKDSAEVIEIGWILLDAQKCEEVGACAN